MNWRGQLKKNWIMLYNQSAVNILINPYLLCNIYPAADPVDVHSSGGTNHCDTKGTLPDFGDVLIFYNVINKILYFVLVPENYGVSYDNAVDIFTIHTKKKVIHFHCSQHGIYYHDCTPRKHTTFMVHTVKGNTEGFTNLQVSDTKQAQQVYNTAGCTSPSKFRCMVCGNTIRFSPTTISAIYNTITNFGSDVVSTRGKTAWRTPNPVVSEYITVKYGILDHSIKLEIT